MKIHFTSRSWNLSIFAMYVTEKKNLCKPIIYDLKWCYMKENYNFTKWNCPKIHNLINRAQWILVRQWTRYAIKFSLAAVDCALSDAASDRFIAYRDYKHDIFAHCRNQQQFFCFVQANAKKVLCTQFNAKKVAWCISTQHIFAKCSWRQEKFCVTQIEAKTFC